MFHCVCVPSSLQVKRAILACASLQATLTCGMGPGGMMKKQACGGCIFLQKSQATFDDLSSLAIYF